MIAVAALVAVVALSGSATQTVSGAPAKKPDAVPGELVVGFQPGVSDSAQVAVLSKAGATKSKSLKQIRASLVKVPESRLAAVTKALEGDPRVRYVEPNAVVSLAATPNDPSFPQLYGLHNTGQTGGTADADIDAPEAWDLETGSSSVVVAVTDTGVDFGHPDLAAQQWVNPGENCGSSDPTIACDERANGVDDDGDGYVDDHRGWDFVSGDNNPVDDHNHGTHVSGTIGAVGDNGLGVVGVNWNVRIMALKVLDSSGSGTSANGAAATVYAADHGAVVASNSWGGGPAEQVLKDAIAYAASKGTLFTAAAGNNGTNNDTSAFYPASFDSDDLVAVAATDANDNFASFSNYGAKSVDLAAPGVSILSTVRGGGYQSFSGTSMATPHVSGAAALVKARFPGATAYGIKALLMRSVDTKASLSGKVLTNGRLNVGSAVSCSNEPKVLVTAPANGFVAGVGDSLPIKVIGANCATPAGTANVGVTVNGTPVGLSAASPDGGLYTGTYTVGSTGAVSVTATVTVGGSTATQTVTGTAAQNYTCQDVSDPWVDVTPGTKLSTASSSDDGFSTLNITFPFTFFGQTYSTAYVSSNGFVTLGSSAGADAPSNKAIPTSTTPNGIIAPFWDDLNPAAAGDVYAGITGSVGNRVLHLEWFNVPHWTLFGSVGAVTFEMSLHEATGKIVYRWLDTDFGDPAYNFGAAATAGVEDTAGVVGRQLGFNEPVLTAGRAVSCTFGSAPPLPPPAIGTSSLPDATNTVAYSQTLSASGGTPPYTWSVSAGSLPSGLTLNPATGALGGTPNATVGDHQFTVQVTDGASQSDTQDLTLALADPLAVTTTSLSGGTVGQGYSQSVAATGGKTPYAWSLASGNLPPGLGIDASTGAVSGTPTTAGSYDFTVLVGDSGSPARSDTQDLSIVVTAPPVPAVTTTSLPDGTRGASYGATLTAGGGTPGYTWSLDAGALPDGLTLDGATGAITGTLSATAATSTFTVEVADSLSQTDTKELSIVVADPLAVTTAALPGWTVGRPYSQTLAASGGHAPRTWGLASGALPTGLALNGSTGAITGTPSAAGTFDFTVEVTDSGNPVRSATKAFSIVIATAPSVTTTNLPQGKEGSPYSANVNASGGTDPFTWAVVSGSLPPGLSLSQSGTRTATISGTPTTRGTFAFTIRVTDAAGAQATRTLSIRIKR